MELSEYKMSFKAIFLYRLRIIIAAVIAAFICGGLTVFFPLISLILSFCSAVLLIIIFFCYPALLYRRYKIKITDNGLYVTKGVIFLKKYCTALESINYIGMVTTPLQKIFGIFSLCIYTKSGQILLINLENIPSRLRGFTDE